MGKRNYKSPHLRLPIKPKKLKTAKSKAAKKHGGENTSEAIGRTEQARTASSILWP